jgi:hypothetical protein
VTAQLQQSLVEGLVEGEELLQVDARLLLPGQIGVQLCDQVGVELGRQVVQRGQLDRLAQELGIGDAVRVDPRDERTHLREDLHQALLGEQDEAFPDRRPAHPHGCGQLVLRQSRARGQLQGQHLAAQRLVDDTAVGALSRLRGHVDQCSRQV